MIIKVALFLGFVGDLWRFYGDSWEIWREK